MDKEKTQLQVIDDINKYLNDTENILNGVLKAGELSDANLNHILKEVKNAAENKNYLFYCAAIQLKTAQAI